MTNGYRTFIIKNTFNAGMAVQRVITHLAANHAGDALAPQIQGEWVGIEIYTHNPLVMEWIENQFAPFLM